MEQFISSFKAIAPSIPYIVNGIWVTLGIALGAAIIGFVLGTLLSLCKISNIKLLNGFARGYTSIFRGTPLIMQLALAYLAIPQLIGLNDVDPTTCAIITFGLNSGAYMSEIIRSGINAVDKGQFEAAGALGVGYWSMMKDIILPQAIKNILPAMMNEFITLTKDSAIVSTIAVTDMMRRSQIVSAQYYTYFPPMFVAFIMYYLVVLLLTFIGGRIERRLSRSDQG
ncbi:amino acid ABC transporter permease [Sporolactobacillus laevolacticus]|uniref:Arginine ABC transporter permease n=1 Tax=Sporolactobacillus laevolacticus DSM 442 TaxID=1395513 RepID=V6J6E4_9BACL|nr:amino acid ABC transporter permease [Sporolactobacillus laevolacticus]EST12339.1 arginine ABC transporter permease [Sporolactobacillus laevolacticus DSM 442]